MIFQWLIYKQSCLNSTRSWSFTSISLCSVSSSYTISWHERINQSWGIISVYIDEYSLAPSLVLFLDGFANVVAAIAAVICLQAVLQKPFGILMAVVWLCCGFAHNETVSHNYLCPPFTFPCSPEAETITDIHCGHFKINNYLYSFLVVVNANF